MTAVTYDLQKLDEAVAILASGAGGVQERLSFAALPLNVLNMGTGMTNAELQPRLAEICERLSGVKRLDNDDAMQLASDIAGLQSSAWHAVVWALEDGENRR